MMMMMMIVIKNAKVRDEESGGFCVFESYVAQGSLFVSPAVPRDERMTVKEISHGNGEDSLRLEEL